jgi:hypothetical protein
MAGSPEQVHRTFLDALNARDLVAAQACVDTATYQEDCVESSARPCSCRI